jgi:energy-coupling factor transporter ATP-binding protein EcfA2
MSMENPFPGLRPFEADESHLFFGRESASDDLLRKLRQRRFIAVIGTSGSGKSSLVRAGMLPDLYGGGMASAGSLWRTAIFRPGDAPIAALARALGEARESSVADAELRLAITEATLRRGAYGLVEWARQARMTEGEKLLVLVDQFEELFRTQRIAADDADEAKAFVKLLLAAIAQNDLPIYVILTMRSEYLGECTRFRDLPEAMNEGQYLIPRMNRDQRHQAIAGPVAVAGAKITSTLMQRLLNDVGENPDQLPIMQHAMMRTWDIWAAEGNPQQPIDLPHYEATGTMANALSRHADEIYLGLADEQQRRIVEKVFKRLTGMGPDQREMRYPTTMADLCGTAGRDPAQVIPVIDAFRLSGRSFLMPPQDVELQDDTIVDISHESLIRIWKRLNDWLGQEALSARIYCRLAEDAELHQQGEMGLRRNPELDIARRWRSQAAPNAAWADRYNPGFEQAMSYLHRSEKAATRRKVLSLGAAIALPLAAVIGVAHTKISKLNQEQEVAQTIISELAQENEEIAFTLDNVTEQLVSNEEVQQERQGGTQPDLAADPAPIVQASPPPPNAVDSTAAADEKAELAASVLVASVAPKAAVLAATDAMPSDASSPSTPLPEEQTGVTIAEEPEPVDAFAELQAKLAADPGMTVQRQLSAWRAFLDQPRGDAAKLSAESRIQAIESALKRSASIKQGENFVTCKDVKRLVPIDITDTFPVGRVYLMATVHAPREADLTVNWLREDGSLLFTRNTRVQTNTGRGFRTFSWKTITEPGNYAVQMLNEDGQVIGFRRFTVR